MNIYRLKNFDMVYISWKRVNQGMDNVLSNHTANHNLTHQAHHGSNGFMVKRDLR